MPGIAGSIVDQKWFNAVQEELASPVEGIGYALESGYRSQLLRTLQLADLMRAPFSANLAATGASDDFKAIRADGNAPANLKVVAVGANGAIYRQGDQSCLFTALTPAASYTGTFNDLCFPGGSFGWVFVGNDEEIQTTDGGIARRNTVGEHLLSCAHNGAGTVVACGNNGKIMRSTTPATWTDPTAALSGALRSVAFGAGLFVIAGANGIQTSPDGTTWTSRVATGGSGAYYWVRYVAGFGFVALGRTNGSLSYSADGITWTTGGSVASDTAINKFVATRAGLLCFGVSATPRMSFYRVNNTTLDYDAPIRSTCVDPIWADAAYDSYQRGLWLAGEGGEIGFHAMPFGA